MAAELVETSRLFARTVAAIDPAWAEPLAGDLAKRTYPSRTGRRSRAPASPTSGSRCSACRSSCARRSTRTDRPGRGARAVPAQRPGRGGLAVRASSQRALRVRPGEPGAAARARRGGGADAAPRHPGRRRGGGEFYDGAIPADVTDVRGFERWWKKAQADDPRAAHHDAGRPARRAGCRRRSSTTVPRPLGAGRAADALRYRFEPGAETTESPSRCPSRCSRGCGRTASTGWCPGCARSSSPPCSRVCRRRSAATSCPPPTGHGGFSPSCRRGPRRHGRGGAAHGGARASIRSATHTVSSPPDFDLERLPPHLRMTFAAVDERGRRIASSKDLAELQSRLADRTATRWPRPSRRRRAAVAGPGGRAARRRRTRGCRGIRPAGAGRPGDRPAILDHPPGSGTNCRRTSTRARRAT